MDLTEIINMKLDGLLLDPLLPQIESKLVNIKKDEDAEQKRLEAKQKYQEKKLEIETQELLIAERDEHIQPNEEEIMEIIKEYEQSQNDATSRHRLAGLRTELVHRPFKEQLVDRDNELKMACRIIEHRLGFRLKVDNTDSNGVWLITFDFADSNTEHNVGTFVSLKFSDTSERFELIEIRPNTPKFDELRNYLAATNDVTGLLYVLSKYFARNRT